MMLREIIEYYERNYQEDARLGRDAGPLEFARTQELILRYLPAPPALLIDAGGGPGAYSVWLASLGYRVILLDPVPKHVNQARASGLPCVAQGDARMLPFADECADAVLLMGPLYHLVDREERIRALRESWRVLRPGGVLLAAAISRFASLLDGLFTGAIDDPRFQKIVARDLAEGQHRNAADRPDYFTTAYFHHPRELAGEVGAAGFDSLDVVAVEGPAWMSADFEMRWADPERRRVLMDLVRRVEREESLLGMSLHLAAAGRKAVSSPAASAPGR